MEYQDKITYSNLEEYKREIDYWYRRYNISREKVILFHDFLISLYEIIDDTYMGDDLLQDDEDIQNHFKWCWNNVIESFNQEKIFFKKEGPHFDYIMGFFYEGYYMSKRKNQEVTLLRIFDVIFNENVIKIQSELETFTDLYLLFNVSLKK